MRVTVVDSYEGISLPRQPPSTAGLRRLARFDRSVNFHGTLDDDFYLASDSVHEPIHLVLWYASDGSQDDTRIMGGDLLPTGAVERIFESARYNLPLDLSDEEEDFR